MHSRIKGNMHRGNSCTININIPSKLLYPKPIIVV